MAAKYRKFNVPAREITETTDEPDVGICLCFRNSDGKVIIEQDFDCLPRQPAIASSMWSGHWPDGRTATVLDILAACMTNRAELEFMSMLERKDLSYDSGDMIEAAKFLLETYSARPTSLPVASANGQPNSADSSTDS